MTKRNLYLIGFVLSIFCSVLITSCGEEKVTAITTQPASLSYHTEFDSIERVIEEGWRAINKSNPATGENWQAGAYIATVSANTLFKNSPFYSNISAHSYKASANEYALCPYTVGDGLSFINCWLLTPALSMKNGDVISFWTTTSSPVSYPDRLQVWLNTANDGTNVGGNQTETGDFTAKLLEINPSQSTTGYPTSWTKYEITLSGLPNGSVPKKLRIGFRYYVQAGGTAGSNSNEIGIDDFDFISQ
ncbi:MAG TPA: choice-of-anchor J domain-containing protein [Chitinophagaceae bacterium]